MRAGIPAGGCGMVDPERVWKGAPNLAKGLARGVRAVSEDAARVSESAHIEFDGGGQSPGPVKSACIVEMSDGSVVKRVETFEQGTHNFAEYQALMLGLRLAREHGARKVLVKGDSALVVNQVNGEWKVKHPTLIPLRAEARDLLEQFDDWRVEWVPRKENRRADALGRT